MNDVRSRKKETTQLIPGHLVPITVQGRYWPTKTEVRVKAGQAGFSLEVKQHVGRYSSGLIGATEVHTHSVFSSKSKRWHHYCGNNNDLIVIVETSMMSLCILASCELHTCGLLLVQTFLALVWLQCCLHCKLQRLIELMRKLALRWGWGQVFQQTGATDEIAYTRWQRLIGNFCEETGFPRNRCLCQSWICNWVQQHYWYLFVLAIHCYWTH